MRALWSRCSWVVLAAACSAPSSSVLVPAADAESSNTEREGAKAPDDSSATDGGADDGRVAPRDAAREAATALDSGDAGLDGALTSCLPKGVPTSACAGGRSPTFETQWMHSQPHQGSARSVLLQLDAGGFFHGTWSSGEGVAYYLTNRSGAFTLEAVAVTPTSTETIDTVRLALDACSRPTLIYQRSSYAALRRSSRLFIATKDLNGWTEEEIVVPKSDTDPTPSTNIEGGAVIVNAAGSPTIIVSRGGQKLVLLERSGTGWSNQTLPFSMYQGNGPVARMSPTSGLVLAYVAFPSLLPAFARKVGGTWIESVATGSTTRAGGSDDEPNVSLAVGPDGRIHLAYATLLASGDLSLRYTSVAPGGTFSAEQTVPTPNGNGKYGLNIAAPAIGDVRVSFDQLAVRSTGNGRGAWMSRMTAGAFGPAVPVPPFVGNCSSGSAVDENGREHVLLVCPNERPTIQTQACAP